VETVQVAAHTVVSLVSDLLDLSKAEVGRLRLEAAPFDPKATVSEVVRVLEGQARAKGIALREEFGDVHGMVLGDAHRVRQILVNLAGNAIKFTSRGSVSIRVSQGDGDHPEPALLRFEVDDTGIGIPPDRLDAIFEDFEQVDASTTRLYGGTGLGLGISRHLVHLMGGVIGVDSSVGEGSMFWFEVPLPAVEAEEERTPARRVRVVGRPAERSHAASMLRSEGWLVDEADTLAHPSARSEPAVFVGPVDGLGRSIDLGSTVVVDTSPRRGNAERVRRRGAAAYVGAPASSEELETVLERVADGAPFLTRHDLSSPATSLRILAADDAPSNRLLVERTLSRRGHRVVSVGGGRDAIAAFESGEFDVVVLDGQMPDLSGVEVTRHIRARDAETGGHTPIVALTGRVGEEERAEVLAAGADLWVAKPFDVRRLHEVVEQAGGRLTPAQPAAGEAGVVLDLDVFRAQVAGLPEFAAELADTVRQEWAELEPAFRSESVRVDLEGTRAAAHRMRGVLGMVGAVEATAVATALEEAARSGDLRASLGFAGDLRASFTAVETALGEALFALAATRPE
jgi:two-component system, sensor histidine kinase and response regulator